MTSHNLKFQEILLIGAMHIAYYKNCSNFRHERGNRERVQEMEEHRLFKSSSAAVQLPIARSTALNNRNPPYLLSLAFTQDPTKNMILPPIPSALKPDFWRKFSISGGDGSARIDAAPALKTKAFKVVLCELVTDQLNLLAGDSVLKDKKYPLLPQVKIRLSISHQSMG
jgi:hypothetical protein